MITFKDKPESAGTVEKLLHPHIRHWFYKRFREFSLPQLLGVNEIHSRKNILVSAPTGATKTLTAFMAVLNELVDTSLKGNLGDRVYAVYISPLKALNYDIQVNLLEPLREIQEIAGKELGIRVDVRTGDTLQKDRLRMSKKPPHILITTPESLAILLNAPLWQQHLAGAEWCIIDEIHALAENKRGAHLSLSLERLERLCSHMTRIGLSATISPLEEIAGFLVGPKRDCMVIDVQFLKDLDLKVLSPVDDLVGTGYGVTHKEMYGLMHALIQEHKTTLIFTNTRAATERVVDNLKDMFPSSYGSNIGAHHGSLSKEHRHRIESSLREGSLKCVVCSTSLELGIDIGYIDLVILLGSPKSVARALQRIGRSGHKLHAKAKGRMIVMDRDDLVECSVLLKQAVEKKIDTIHIPKNCLDVLAQHIVGIALNEKISVADLGSLIRSSYTYEGLSQTDLINTLKFLSGKFSSLEERNIFARIWYDEEEQMIGKKGRMSRVIYMTNIGTIPDETAVLVKVGAEIVGSIEESFLEKLKPGDVFVLGGSTYMFRFSRGMVAQVSATANRPPSVPRWFSESLPLSFDLACEIGRFRRLMSEKLNIHLNHGVDKKESKEEILKWIDSFLYIDDKGARSIYNYLLEQFLYVGIPHDRRILIESYDDEGRHYHIFHSMFGRRVNDCLSRATAFAIGRMSHRDVEIGINDNGFYLASGKAVNVKKAFSFLKDEKLELVMDQAIERSEVYKRRFRHCAGRALMILRNYKGQQKNVGRQQVSSGILMNALKRIDPDFTILKEARREVLEDLMDIGNARKVLSSISLGRIVLAEARTDVPSPFAVNLITQGMSDIMRIEDRNDFVRRMHQMVIAKIAVKEGSDELDMPRSIDLVPRRVISKEQKVLLSQLEAVRIAEPAKDVISRFILGDEDNQPLLRLLKENRDEILKWPKMLSRFLLKKLYEDDRANFSYESVWGQEDELAALLEEERKEELILDVKKAARSVGLDAQIQYDIVELIDDPNKETIRDDTRTWLDGLLRGAVPKIWSDRLIKHLKKRRLDL